MHSRTARAVLTDEKNAVRECLSTETRQPAKIFTKNAALPLLSCVPLISTLTLGDHAVVVVQQPNTPLGLPDLETQEW